MDQVLTVDETARLLKVNARTIQRLCKNDELPCTRMGRSYRILAADLVARGFLSPAALAPVASTPPPHPAASPRPGRGRPLSTARVLALANQKGGVGKTTTTINLGAALAERGQRVLLIDADSQANLTLTLTGQLDVQPSLADVLLQAWPAQQAVRPASVPDLALLPGAMTLNNVDLHPTTQVARTHILRPVVRALAPAYDFVLIDCPPTLGTLTIAALMAATEVIVPVRPSLFSAVGLAQLYTTITTIQTTLDHGALEPPRLLINQAALQRDGTARTVVSRTMIADLRRQYGRSMYATTIPDAVAVEEAHHAAVSVVGWDPQSAVATAYRALAEEVLRHA